MINTWNLKAPLLKFALADAGDNSFRSFCKHLIEEHLNTEFDGRLANEILRDYQGASGPLSLGRHLLTDISINALNLSRTEEYGDMYYKQGEFKLIIDSLKDKFPTQYQDAIDELRSIASETQNLIRKSGKAKVKLYRRLCDEEGKQVSEQLGSSKIFMDVNILASYTPTNNLTGYTGVHWSDIVIERYIPVDQVIIHPNYIQIADFEFAEREVIIYNPNQRVVMQHPDKAFEI